jgi:hypothetical protein
MFKLVALLLVLAYAYCDVYLDRLKLPTGWKIEQLVSAPNARQMTIDIDETVLFIGTKDHGKLYAVPLTRDDVNFKYSAGICNYLTFNTFSGTLRVIKDGLTVIQHTIIS